MLKEGRPLAYGSYKGLCESGIDFMNLIQTEVKSESKSKSDEIINEELMASQELFPRKRTGSSVSAEYDVNFMLFIVQ